MPSSVRSGTPRLANVRTNSSTSIHIDREVTVVTSAADGPNKRNVYSTMPSGSNTHGRSQSSQGLSTAPAPVLNRWNSTSKMSDISSRFTNERPQSSKDLTMVDSNRDSMRALAEFLKRSEPPLSSYTSRPDSDSGSVHSVKKSALRMFGRSKTKKATKGPRLLQLPDSAVAAKTTSGARHIAISIPLEYDYPYYEAPAPSLIPPRPHTQPKLSSERGAITVLKPVAEVRESGSTFFTKAPSSEEPNDDKRLSHAESVTTPVVVLGPETTRTLQNYYTQLNRQQRNRSQGSKAEGKVAVRPDPTTTHRSYVAITPIDIARQDSTRTDPRHSGGTAYSTASIGTYPAHSRNPSSASNAPSGTTTPMKLELPPRKSSVTKVNPGIQTELAKAYVSNKVPANEDPASASFLSDKSALYAGDSTTTTGTSTSHSPPTAIGTAETAQSYNDPASVQIVSGSTTPKSSHPTSPAPTRQLPDVPESPCVPSFYPSPSPPISRKNSPTIGVIDDTFSDSKRTVSIKSTEDSRPQSRQDRVKARKQRDMAVHRDKSAAREKAPLAESPSSTNPQILITTPRSGKRRSVSQDIGRKKTLNSITEIMLVADLAPYTGEVRLGDLPLAHDERAAKRRVKDSDSNGNMSGRGAHTPPSSMESESDTVTQGRSLVRSRRGSRNSGLDVRRQERRMKRNISLREKEMEARLGKIERDNAMLLSTLSGIANSFGELSKVLPRTGMGFKRETGLLTEVEREMRDGGSEEIVRGDLTRLDPVMQDLELGAGKVSQENLEEERIGYDYDD